MAEDPEWIRCQDFGPAGRPLPSDRSTDPAHFAEAGLNDRDKTVVGPTLLLITQWLQSRSGENGCHPCGGILDMREKLPHPRGSLIGSLDCITFAYSAWAGRVGCERACGRESAVVWLTRGGGVCCGCSEPR